MNLALGLYEHEHPRATVYCLMEQAHQPQGKCGKWLQLTHLPLTTKTKAFNWWTYLLMFSNSPLFIVLKVLFTIFNITALKAHYQHTYIALKSTMGAYNQTGQPKWKQYPCRTYEPKSHMVSNKWLMIPTSWGLTGMLHQEHLSQICTFILVAKLAAHWYFLSDLSLGTRPFSGLLQLCRISEYTSCG